MTDPRDKAASIAPPTLGEGCLSRYDPEALTSEDGADFAGAAELWRALHPLPEIDPQCAQRDPASDTDA